MCIDTIKQIKGQKIAFAVLNWGLGHASRSSVLIKQLIKKNQLIILSDGLSLQWLKIEFPECQLIELPSYSTHYKHSQMWLNMFIQLPHYYKTYKKERIILKNNTRDAHIDLIISDNRWGCYNSKIQSIFITHQIKIPHPNSLLSFITTVLNKCLIQNFDECWIPDSQDHKYSGHLSRQSLGIPIKNIGLLSSLTQSKVQKDIDLLIILSGPEPSRSLFEEKLHSISWPKDKKVIVIRGTNSKSPEWALEHFDLIGRTQLNELLNRSRKSISRSGYSTIMDFVLMKVNALLIPTPNQPEQEYLAKLHANSPQFQMMHENEPEFQNEVLTYLNSTI